MKSYQTRKNKSFANYRVKAIQLLREYSAYEKHFIGTLADDVKQLQKNKAVELIMGKIKEGKEGDIDVKEIIENAGEYLDLAGKVAELNEQTALSKELFLMDNEYAKLKELCGIVYEDFDGLEFETYEELREFAFNTLDAFFLNNQNILNTGNSTKQSLTSKSQTTTREI